MSFSPPSQEKEKKERKMKKRSKAPLMATLLSFFLLTFVFQFHHKLATRIHFSDPSLRLFTQPNLNSKSNPNPLLQHTASVLLQDWQILVFQFYPSLEASRRFSCLFRDNSVTPARATSSNDAFVCPLPRRLRLRRPFYSPLLVASDNPVRKHYLNVFPLMLRWNWIVYESLSTANDVIVFAKGVNTKQGSNRPASDLTCLFYLSDSRAPFYTTAATSSSQEVFRCHHPDLNALPESTNQIFVSLRISNSDYSSDPLPSVAIYSPPSSAQAVVQQKMKICACTMVYNSAKFLPEWVRYHTAIGVEKFFLYDNGSDDRLNLTVNRLQSNRFAISTRFWPWPKSQEAAFSHCAAINRDRCEWMAFIDVDEFVYSPSWSNSTRPNRSMLGSFLPDQPRVGQVSIGCYDFSPSGQTSHPKNGVVKGYTCRRHAEERHKSLVRLDAVDRSLVNSIHHFGLRDGYEWGKVGWARINHYKYQAWDEFKVKFRRRASAFVPDWMDKVNPASRDRTPGLGFEPVQPAGWAWKFCETNDTRLRDLTSKWFHR
ncbi:hypothetical protein LUZ61_020510 [Rhynchospora tenuis]|uniref:Glycosyltransferase family 92 protein n=1 Tax=Rhynchospora tenuis TaxID=198213 RepID=A0AAD5ZD39_9POAL|nr:hypothetical protein LUZ61_020510 [Rhynchospora tenuis]